MGALVSASPLLLLVEDDTPIREAVTECLEAEGYRVQAAAHGAEALAWLQGGGRPALVLLDLVMPVMSGPELINRMRAEAGLATTPVLLMTAAITAAGKPLPRVDATLSKPFDLDALLAAVKRLVRGR